MYEKSFLDDPVISEIVHYASIGLAIITWPFRFIGNQALYGGEDMTYRSHSRKSIPMPVPVEAPDAPHTRTDRSFVAAQLRAQRGPDHATPAEALKDIVEREIIPLSQAQQEIQA